MPRRRSWTNPWTNPWTTPCIVHIIVHGFVHGGAVVHGRWHGVVHRFRPWVRRWTMPCTPSMENAMVPSIASSFDDAMASSMEGVHDIGIVYGGCPWHRPCLTPWSTLWSTPWHRQLTILWTVQLLLNIGIIKGNASVKSFCIGKSYLNFVRCGQLFAHVDYLIEVGGEKGRKFRILHVSQAFSLPFRRPHNVTCLLTRDVTARAHLVMVNNVFG